MEIVTEHVPFLFSRDRSTKMHNKREWISRLLASEHTPRTPMGIKVNEASTKILIYFFSSLNDPYIKGNPRLRGRIFLRRFRHHRIIIERSISELQLNGFFE